jgi:hypothetical protein
MPGENSLSTILLELIVFKLNPSMLVFQLLAVPILAIFLVLLLLPPRDLGTLFSCLVTVICGNF